MTGAPRQDRVVADGPNGEPSQLFHEEEHQQAQGQRREPPVVEDKGNLRLGQPGTAANVPTQQTWLVRTCVRVSRGDAGGGRPMGSTRVDLLLSPVVRKRSPSHLQVLCALPPQRLGSRIGPSRRPHRLPRRDLVHPVAGDTSRSRNIPLPTPRPVRSRTLTRLSPTSCSAQGETYPDHRVASTPAG